MSRQDKEGEYKEVSQAFCGGARVFWRERRLLMKLMMSKLKRFGVILISGCQIDLDGFWKG